MQLWSKEKNQTYNITELTILQHVEELVNYSKEVRFLNCFFSLVLYLFLFGTHLEINNAICPSRNYRIKQEANKGKISAKIYALFELCSLYFWHYWQFGSVRRRNCNFFWYKSQNFSSSSRHLFVETLPTKETCLRLEIDKSHEHEPVISRARALKKVVRILDYRRKM